MPSDLLEKQKKNIKDGNIIGSQTRNNENKLFGRDYERSKNYKIVKESIDEVHRKFIEESLSENGITKYINKDSLKEFYKIWKNRKNNLKLDNKKKKEIQEKEQIVLNELINGLEKAFEQTTIKWKDKYSELNKAQNENKDKKKKFFEFLAPARLLKSKSSNKESESSILEQMIDQKVIVVPDIQKRDKTSYTEKELQKAIKSFDKFATYFEVFRKNREHIYNIPKKDKNGKYPKLKSGSIAHRLFECNLLFHFKNIEKWQTISKSIDDLQNEVLQKYFEEAVFDFNLNELFQPASFLKYLSQSGIDKYNEILGGPPTERQKGLNGIISEIQQKAQSNRKKFPIMQELYKQILSKDDRCFIDVFDDDEEMLKAIRNFYETIQHKDLLKELRDNIEKHLNSLNNSDLKEHYLSREFIRGLSKHVFLEELDSGKILDNWWVKYVDEKRKNNKGNLLSKKVKEREYKRKALSFSEIQKTFQYLQEKGEFNIKEKYQRNSQTLIQKYITFRLNELISEGWKNQNNEEKKSITSSWDELTKSRILQLEVLDKTHNKEKEKQIVLIKEFLDACSVLHRFIRSLIKKETFQEISNETWQEILEDFTNKFPIINLYNKVRNKITKKEYSTDKIKINFENYQLLKGWDQNTEKAYTGVILRKNNLFYLGIIGQQDKEIFDYNKNGTDKQKKCYKDIFGREEVLFYEKMTYKVIPNPSRDLPKKFFSERHRKIYKPSQEILKIKDNKTYQNNKKDEKVYIKFMIDSIRKSEWVKYFNFKGIKSANRYESLEKFYQEIEKEAYKIDFEDKIPESYISEKIKKGDLYLFQIYNKDFSQEKKSKGKDNLHTLYWKSLFEKINLEKGITQLNGGAAIFYRKASLKKEVIHLKNNPIKNKNSKNHKKESQFEYDIIKNERFTKDQFLFHVPVTLNYKNNEKRDINLEVNKLLKNHDKKINIIGIDRGESNLIYYSVINQEGNIIEQASLNTINNFYMNKNNQNISIKYDYHKKLKEMSDDRDQARKNWSKIENIKELKSGYLSQVVHKIAGLVIKHNAIVVLEDLNNEFKNFRKKIEKQVYQKFEKALIDKLNYLVFKKSSLGEAGHYLKAYQLTAPLKRFEKLDKDKQSGILFYTTAAYTSVTDPVTGFLKNVYYDYTSIPDAQVFWNNFDTIKFNKDKDYFEFTYTIGKIKSRQFNKEDEESDVKQEQWTVCSCVTRSYYRKENEKKTKSLCFDDMHEKIKKLLDQNNIIYDNGKCFMGQLAQNSDSEFHQQMIKCFGLILNMRVKGDSKSNEREKDYILSPVEPFFDSRKADQTKLPIDSDANGAYNIARKGICILKQIKKSELINTKFKLRPINKKDWQDYVQSEEVVTQQRKKV